MSKDGDGWIGEQPATDRLQQTNKFVYFHGSGRSTTWCLEQCPGEKKRMQPVTHRLQKLTWLIETGQ